MNSMMKKTTLYLFMMMAFMACGGGDDEDDNVKKPDYIAANEELEMPDANETTLSIRANCKWTLYPEVDWLSVDPASGENNSNVTITASPNKTGARRSGTIYMRNEAGTLENKVIVSQKAAPENSFVPEPGENPLPV